MSIPSVEVAALFCARPDATARAAIDAEIHAAACEVGFMTVTGLADRPEIGEQARARLLQIFTLDDAARRRLWRQKFAPENANVYRGFFPVQAGNLTHKEGIDLGADVAYGHCVLAPDDPLREPTPLPAEHELPGWRRTAADYYLGMETVSKALMRSIARCLRLDEAFFDAAFHRGLSTLRLLRYPARAPQELAACTDPRVWVEDAGARRYVTGAPHTDSGFMTLLAQSAVPGLQARARDGRWLGIPPQRETFVVNFGKVLELWSGGRIRATEHRVVGCGEERFSIPFFHEARADAEIRPLPMDDSASFEPFLFGDYLWARIGDFVEFRGIRARRKPSRPC